MVDLTSTYDRVPESLIRVCKSLYRSMYLPSTVFFLCPQLHEFDELRFDIRAHDCTYFLRASSVEEKNSWVEAIEANKVSQTSVCCPVKWSDGDPMVCVEVHGTCST